MTVPTASELTLLQTRPQQTKLWLSIYQPQTLLAARVNNVSIAKGERTIAYDNVTSGSYTSVASGMVMLVGSTLGGDEKGRIRVRSASATEIEVAENSHINWADNDYLTVLNFVEITAVFPRIIQDPVNDEQVIFYKDYDIAYTNQNSLLGTFICMGSHEAIFLENGSAQVFYSASGTSHLLGSTLTYDWYFQGATVTGSSAHTPGLITYDTPGHYMTRLTVQATGSYAETSYRYVSVYDRPEDGTSNPILQWEFDNMTGSRDNGGYTLRIRIREDVPKSIVRDGSLVVIFADDWYGNTKQSIGGNAINRSKIFFVGYILEGTINYNWRESFIEFDVGSPTEIMKVTEGFSVSVESKSSPTTWYELLDMDCRRALYHYLYWHSTVLKCCDFEFRGTDKKIQYFDSDRTSIYDAIQNLMNGTLIGAVVSDRQGKIYSEVDISVTNNAASSFPVALQMNKQHWMDEPIIEERIHGEVSFVEAGGIAYSGSATGTFSAHLAGAPGDSPGYRGNMQRFQGLALLGQDDLNTLVGNYYTFKNSEYPMITFPLAGNYRNFDIAPQELIQLTLYPEDTERGVTFLNKPFAVRNMSWSYLARNTVLLPTLGVAEVTQGFPGDSIPIPDTPPYGGFEQPPFEFPPFPYLNCPPGIRLYDEGIYQGRITAIDFIGGAVSAFISGSADIGQIVISCGDAVRNINADARYSISENISDTSDTLMTWGSGNSFGFTDYYQFLTFYPTTFETPRQRIVFNKASGYYRIQVEARIVFGNGAGESLTLGQSYYAILKIKHYNSSNGLKSTNQYNGSDAYVYLPNGIGTIPEYEIETSYVHADLTISVEVGDYITVSLLANQKTGAEYDDRGSFSVFNVWRIPESAI